MNLMVRWEDIRVDLLQCIDYEETFSPVVKMVTIRCLLNLDVQCIQLDVNNAFLYGDLDETVYMKLPDGYYHANDTRGVFIALLVYVDDIIIGNSVIEIEKFNQFLKTKFMIKDLEKLKYFLGIEVIDTKDGICLNQRKYCLDLLSAFGMLAYKPSTVSLPSKLVISNEPTSDDHLIDNITEYQKLMKNLINLTNTRSHISYAVHCLSQFMHSSFVSHSKIAFKILRYLKGTPGMGVHITKIPGMNLCAYSNADWAKCIVTGKLVIGYCVFLCGSLVSWKSKKQTLSQNPALMENYHCTPMNFKKEKKGRKEKKLLYITVGRQVAEDEEELGQMTIFSYKPNGRIKIIGHDIEY
ncbi:ribonuclease H-like domain-containing protein [Tanacetum coccineum]